MPYPFGVDTKTKILKSESQKLFQEFEVGTVKATLTFAGNLIIANSTVGTINGVAITAVVYDTSHAATMALLVTELEAHADVASAELTSPRVITITATGGSGALVLASWLVTAGDTQTTIATATDTNAIVKGQMVQLQSDGTIEPVINGNYRYTSIGVAMHDGLGEELVTVMMKAFVIIFMEAATDSLVAGPVTIHSNGQNSTTGYLEVDDASVTTANMLGWCLDEGDDGDVVRVAIAP